MKIQKKSDGGWEIKTKKTTIYFSFYRCWCDCAVPLRFNLEYTDKDYTEIWLQILFFNFCFTRISHKFANELDRIYGGEE